MTDTTSQQPSTEGMSRKTARRIEYGIIGLCVIAMALIFQPFVKIGFTAGCILVVVGGLAFNLVPFCEPGKPLRKVINAGVIVLIVFAVTVLLALGSAHLYGIYLSS